MIRNEGSVRYIKEQHQISQGTGFRPTSRLAFINEDRFDEFILDYRQKVTSVEYMEFLSACTHARPIAAPVEVYPDYADRGCHCTWRHSTQNASH